MGSTHAVSSGHYLATSAGYQIIEQFPIALIRKTGIGGQGILDHPNFLGGMYEKPVKPTSTYAQRGGS